MKAKFMKSALSLTLALCMIFSLSSVCFAAEPATEPAAEPVLVDVVDALGDEDIGGVMPLSEIIWGPYTNHGDFGSPEFYFRNGSYVSDLRLHWVCRVGNGGNPNAQWRVRILRQGSREQVASTIVDVSYDVQSVPLGSLPEGDYILAFTPLLHVSGEYVYSFQLYKFL